MYAVVGEHRDFFRRHGWIEFDQLLTARDLESLSTEISSVLSIRMKQSARSTFLASPEKVFSSGRDLWRDRQSIKKILLSRSLAETAGELIEMKPLRFGYDQLFPFPSHTSIKGGYGELLKGSHTLDELSSIQGVLCGLMLCVAAPSEIISSAIDEESSIFTHTVGNGIFFAADMPIKFDALANREGCLYIMLVYTTSKAIYRLEERDPHAYAFKNLGYNYGDRLTEKLNPLVYLG